MGDNLLAVVKQQKVHPPHPDLRDLRRHPDHQ
jgi:hypothetical protein